jgi:signal transduction histidine kinase/DNA-binding response OmpR family regulator
MIRFTLALFFLIYSGSFFSQNKERINNLEIELNNQPTQDKVVEISLELSTLYEKSDLNKAIEYAKKSAEISENINYTTQQIKGLHQLGKLYSFKKDYDQALTFHQKALKIATEYSNPKAIAYSYINMGNVYSETSNEKLAKENFFNAIKIGQKIKNQTINAIANTSLGALNKKLKKYNIATQFYIEALGNILQTDNIYLQGIAYKNVGVMERLINNKDKSTESFKRALQKLELVDDKKELSEVNFALGEHFQEEKDFENAIIYMKNSLGYAELSGHHEYIKKGYENLANIYEKNKDYKNAYDYLKYFSAIKDTKFISELEAQIEIEKKNREIALINQQSQFKFEAERNRSYIILSVAVLILMFSLILYYNLRQKNKINIDLKLATNLANKSIQEKEEFFAFTSHEIRTPLNAVVGMTQLLSKTKLSEIQSKYLKTIKSSANNILFLVNDVLDLAKLEKGAIQLEYIDTSLKDILTAIEDSLSYKTNNKPVKLITKLDPNIPLFVKGDPLRMNQILLNLVDNALKFTKKGEVVIELSVIEEVNNTVNVKFQIRDSGIGITKEKLDKIFESYQQASIDTSRNYGGTGLGLAITKQLIELMGSEIKIESERNKGSTFTFEIAFEKSATTVAETLNENKLEYISNVSILAVDDTSLNRSIFYDLVYSKKDKVSVTLAEDGMQAIDLCKENKFDVIMMDLQMPVLNGFETTKKIRNTQNKNQNTPIIAMTAHVIEGVYERCEKVGMNDYIAKPINISLLFKKIKQYVTTPNESSIEKTDEAIVVEPIKVNLKTVFIDLNSLSELVGGKNEKIVKYIDLFLKNIPKDFASLKEHYLNEDWEETAKAAHKIKGNASYMGINKARELLIEIEKLKEVVADVDKNSDIVDELERILDQASKDLVLVKQNLIAEI